MYLFTSSYTHTCIYSMVSSEDMYIPILSFAYTYVELDVGVNTHDSVRDPTYALLSTCIFTCLETTSKHSCYWIPLVGL